MRDRVPYDCYFDGTGLAIQDLIPVGTCGVQQSLSPHLDPTNNRWLDVQHFGRGGFGERVVTYQH